MVSTSAYTIQLPVYEGPLDLLLELIERAELDITHVALAAVTDQYLAYMRQMPHRHLGDLASFLLIAARLLQIKSEALLPRPPARQPDEEDPGEALARQLIAYKKYKQIANILAERERAGLKTYLRLAPAPAITPTVDLSGLNLQDLQQAFAEALSTEPEGPPLGAIVAPPKVNIEDQIRLIVSAIRAKGKTTFRRLLRKVRSRLEIVVTFLAVLELVKEGRVKAQQKRLFGDIELLPTESWQEDHELDFDLEFDK